jgi:hypothetical protein
MVCVRPYPDHAMGRLEVDPRASRTRQGEESMLEGEPEKRTGRRKANAHTDGSTAARWWMICRSGVDRVEPMTLPCGEEALALFGHEEEAELFLLSLASGGLESGWWIRESRRGEIASALYGPCANVKRVALDPLPMMASEGTIALVSLDRFDFVAGLLARDGSRTRPSHRKCDDASGPQPTSERRFCAFRHPDRSGFDPDDVLRTGADPE